jgi:hypothetical protein
VRIGVGWRYNHLANVFRLLCEYINILAAMNIYRQLPHKHAAYIRASPFGARLVRWIFLNLGRIGCSVEGMQANDAPARVLVQGGHAP